MGVVLVAPIAMRIAWFCTRSNRTRCVSAALANRFAPYSIMLLMKALQNRTNIVGSPPHLVGESALRMWDAENARSLRYIIWCFQVSFESRMTPRYFTDCLNGK